MGMHTRPVLLKAVEPIGNEERIRDVYLHLVKHADGTEEPLRLGTGRSAVVFLATDIQALNQKTEFRAVKFLRDEPDDQIAYSSANRFFQEAISLQRKNGDIKSVVNFLGWGAIARDLTRRGPVNSTKEFWWEQYFDDVVKVSFDENSGTDYQHIKDRFSLQGPFYCLELCHGTLEHLMERSDPWFDLPVYRFNAGSEQAICDNAREVRSDLAEFVQRYLGSGKDDAPPSLDQLARMSGYDILNAFKSTPVKITDEHGHVLRDANGDVVHDPSVIRSHIVLKLFNQIVQSVQHLHQQDEAHRDLKPGNIFFRHSHDLPLKVDVKLADLGYVTNTDSVAGGETLKGGNEQAPGSPFYRAPEQADLPIEVRINVDPDHPNRVYGKGSKISNIEPSDWLFVADLFEEDTSYHLTPDDAENEQEQERAQRTLERRDIVRERRYYQIESAEIDDRSGAFTLHLKQPINSDDKHDLQAQISKSTSFHTDVYSLGALLYDLASGGRNPEHFYTYCLKVFTDQFGVDSKFIPKSIPEIMDILVPTDDTKKKLDLHHRRRFAWLVMTAEHVDSLIEEILKSSYVDLAEEDAKKQIRDYRFRTFDVVNILLTDKRGVKIPREIITIIVRCMLRDKMGSFCQSDQGWSAFGRSGRLIVKEIEDRVNMLLDDTFRLPSTFFFNQLEHDVLFRLRALAFDPDTPLLAAETTWVADSTSGERNEEASAAMSVAPDMPVSAAIADETARETVLHRE